MSGNMTTGGVAAVGGLLALTIGAAWLTSAYPPRRAEQDCVFKGRGIDHGSTTVDRNGNEHHERCLANSEVTVEISGDRELADAIYSAAHKLMVEDQERRAAQAQEPATAPGGP